MTLFKTDIHVRFDLGPIWGQAHKSPLFDPHMPISREKLIEYLRQYPDGRSPLEVQLGLAQPGIPSNPWEYARQVLKVELTPAQEAIARALLEQPFRVLVDSAHNVGKTFLAAAITNWWYDYYDGVDRAPGVVITTAPTERDVIDLLWTEIRLQRQRAGLQSTFTGPRAPEMMSSPDHYAKGYTSRDEVGFQGRHRDHMLFVFDEAEGISVNHFTQTKTMFQASQGHAWLAIGNPTTTDSPMYLEQQSLDANDQPAWTVHRLSALDHPNVVRGLSGDKPEIPGAVTLAQLDQWVIDWCDRVKPEDRQAGDFEWRSKLWRPGPIGEARILGRRPSSGTFGVWSDALWESALTSRFRLQPDALPQIGCDVARHGDDYTEMHVQWGNMSQWHEYHNGWDTRQTAGRLKELCREWAKKAQEGRAKSHRTIEPSEIVVKIDDDGVGGGVVDQGQGYCFVGINASQKPRKPMDYPNRRSELWFTAAELAKACLIDLHLLPKDILQRLRIQAFAPTWEMDLKGRRVVEKKELTKERLGRSPDSMDALNLAYYPFKSESIPVIPNRDERRPIRQPEHQSLAQRRKLFR